MLDGATAYRNLLETFLAICLPNFGPNFSKKHPNAKIMKHDFSLKHIEKSINKSLTRLKTDYIDIYQFHSPNLKKINMLGLI